MKLISLRLSVTRCFLVATDEGYLLVGAGYEGDWDLFRVRLAEANVTLSQIPMLASRRHDDGISSTGGSPCCSG